MRRSRSGWRRARRRGGWTPRSRRPRPPEPEPEAAPRSRRSPRSWARRNERRIHRNKKFLLRFFPFVLPVVEIVPVDQYNIHQLKSACLILPLLLGGIKLNGWKVEVLARVSEPLHHVSKGANKGELLFWLFANDLLIHLDGLVPLDDALVLGSAPWTSTPTLRVWFPLAAKYFSNWFEPRQHAINQLDLQSKVCRDTAEMRTDLGVGRISRLASSIKT